MMKILHSFGFWIEIKKFSWIRFFLSRFDISLKTNFRDRFQRCYHNLIRNHNSFHFFCSIHLLFFSVSAHSSNMKIFLSKNIFNQWFKIWNNQTIFFEIFLFSSEMKGNKSSFHFLEYFHATREQNCEQVFQI
jgi:hypothetical protein